MSVKVTQMQQPFQVFSRWRPLLKQEMGTEIERQQITSTTTPGMIAIEIEQASLGGSVTTNATASTSSKKNWKSSASFTRVFDSEDTNGTVFETAVLPQISHVMSGATSNFFAYGHSGSGKTHTIIGYDEARDAGLCIRAANSLFQEIEVLNQAAAISNQSSGDTETVCADRLGIGIRLYEVRQKSAFDLLNNRQECHVREGDDNKVHIRGTTENLENGKVRVRPIETKPSWNATEFKQQLEQALKLRTVGSSSVHDESSRTHAILELEIINNALLEAREAVSDRHSELVPVGKRATDIYLEESMKSLIKLDDGTYKSDPNTPINQALIDAAEAEKQKYEDAVTRAKQKVTSILASSSEHYGKSCLGGKFVFVDLAGAEFFHTAGSNSDKDNHGNIKQTAKDRNISKQINSDLFALKEVIRARNRNAALPSSKSKSAPARIPFRSSPLTMILREHFLRSDKGNDDDKRAHSAMILTVSPAADMWNATVNTLKYGALVGSSS